MMAWTPKEQALQAADRGARDHAQGVPFRNNPYGGTPVASDWTRGWLHADREWVRENDDMQGYDTNDHLAHNARRTAAKYGGQPYGSSGFEVGHQGADAWSWVILFVALIGLAVCFGVALG